MPSNPFSAGPQMDELRMTYRQLPKLFNTDAISQNYGEQMSQNTAHGMALSGAMRAAAMSRARQSGGQVAASFAGANAMLPYYRQNSEMTGDLARYTQQMAAQRAGMQADIGGQMASLRQRQAGLGADWQNEQNRFGLAQKQFDQQGNQFEKQFGLNERQFSEQTRQFNEQMARQRQNDELQALQLALQYQPQRPAPYFTNSEGGQLSGMGGSEGFRQMMQRQALQRSLLNRAGAYF